MKIRSQQDFYAGLLFLLFGLATLTIASDYAMGSAQRLGPGYFPTVLGWGLVVMGAAMSIRSFFLNGEPIDSVALRPFACILGSVLAFGLLLESAGLAIATFALVILARLGDESMRVWESLLIYLSLTLMSAGIFVYGLGLPIHIWPW